MVAPGMEAWQFTFKQWVSRWTHLGKVAGYAARAEFEDDIGEPRQFEILVEMLPETLLEPLTAQIEALAPGSDVSEAGAGRHGATAYEFLFEDYKVDLEEVSSGLSFGS